MPTPKGLHDSWRTQFKLKLSEEQTYCQDYNSKYEPPKNEETKFTGEKMGTISYDKKTNELKIIPLKIEEKPSKLEKD
ncbi:MAG: hypothetical protein WC812_00515 [Candidatus Pacearchaeota archaeon]|jgi:hypothetical protein